MHWDEILQGKIYILVTKALFLFLKEEMVRIDVCVKTDFFFQNLKKSKKNYPRVYILQKL